VKTNMLLRVGGLTVAPALLGLLLALGSSHWTAGPVGAQAPATVTLRANDCTQDCQFQPNATITIGIGISRDGYAGFQTELFLGAMTYNQRPCEEEVKMEPRSLCLGPTVQTAGQVIHGGTTGLPPLPLPTSSSDTVVEVQATCTQGSHEVLLTHFPSSALGSRLRGPNGEDMPLATSGSRPLNLQDGQGDRQIDIVAALDVQCGTGGPGPQPTSGPGGGVTPGPGQGGATPTPASTEEALQQATARAIVQATETVAAATLAAQTPSGTPTPDGEDGENGDGDESDGDGGGLEPWAWVLIIGGGVAAVAAAGGGYWYWRQHQAGANEGGDLPPPSTPAAGGDSPPPPATP
jgi:hypothetical protein